MRFKDAHCHLHFPHFRDSLPKVIEQQQAYGIEQSVVNGTCEQDWPEVIRLAAKHPRVVLPALGLHPWKVNLRSPKWFETLEQSVIAHQTCIGEVGLDKWIPNHDIAAQKDCLSRQLALAAQHNLPLSIHCLKAWGSLIEILQSEPLPARGVHIHGFGGSREVLDQLLELPVYFSFCGYFLHPRKLKTLNLYQHIPLSRLMLETDAPDMLPPESYQIIPDSSVNYPANIVSIAQGIAQLKNCSVDKIAKRTTKNFDDYFTAGR